MYDLTLTFDNGPEPTVTPLVLDVLARRKIKTTFFFIGSKLVNPEGRACADRAKAEGHWIGNHTWTHSRPLGEQPGLATVEAEISQTQLEIGALSETTPLFRPMGGGGNLNQRLLSKEAADNLQSNKFTCVLWNSVPRDWSDPDGWVETALGHLAQQPWTLMVLHDLPTGAMRHLDRFLEQATMIGTRFRQDFPSECLPIENGKAKNSLSKYVSSDPEL